jgi:pilus assembly protein CpaB
MGRRTLLLIAALVVAGLGTTLVYLYVQGLQDEYAADQRLVQILVANQTISAGTTGAQAEAAGLLELKEIPQAAVVPGALSATTTIQDLRTVGPVFTGEQIIQAQFGEVATSGLTFEDGSEQLGVSVQLSDPARVAGFVRPGSEVAVFVTMSPPASGTGAAPEDGETQTPPASDELPFTRVLLSRVPVVAAGTTTVVSQTVTDAQGQQTVEEIPAAILTLGLTDTDALKVIHAQSQGELYFGLLDEESGVEPGRSVNYENLF